MSCIISHARRRIVDPNKKTIWGKLVPRIWQRFRLSFIICFLCIAMMVIFNTNAVPFEWQIPGYQWALIIPLSLVVGCHILLPVRRLFLTFLLLLLLLRTSLPRLCNHKAFTYMAVFSTPGVCRDGDVLFLFLVSFFWFPALRG